MEIFLFKTLQLILALSLLVFVHELGHFMWARIFKVGVEKFYMFFDTPQFALLRWNKEGLFLCNLKVSSKANPSETEYGIGWIPLGGYCAISGMVDETHSADDIKDMEGDNLFVKKGKFAQFMIMVGGVVNNLITAVIIYICMCWHWGKDVIEIENLPYGVHYSEYAAQIGFQPDDQIVAVDGKEVTFSNLHSALLLANDVTVLRDGQEVKIAMPDTVGQVFLREPEQLNMFVEASYPMVIGMLPEEGEASAAREAGLQVGDSIVGVIEQVEVLGDEEYCSYADTLMTPYSHQVIAQLKKYAGHSINLLFVRGGEMLSAPVEVSEESKIGIIMKNLIGPECLTHIEYSFLESIPAGIQRGWTMLYNYVRQFKLVFTKEGAQSLGGFGTMGSIFPETWQWMAFWSMTAFFSVALAFMNILPIPGLDGGHIFILLIEAIIRRPISDKAKERAQYVGMAIIIALMVYVNANDIWKFIIKPFIG